MRVRGRKGGVEWDGEEEEAKGEGSRRSKVKEVNREGRSLCRYLEETGWGIMNGSTVWDEVGEWTFTGGRGNTVIDYVLGNEDTREKMERLEVGDRIESDHHLVVVWLNGEGREKGGGRKKGGERVGGRGNWSKREGGSL